MLNINERKVLSEIKKIDESTRNQNTNNEYEFMFKSKITQSVNIEEYELNEILRNLNEKGYICNIFNSDNNYIHGTQLTDKGQMALKYNTKHWIIYIFKNYIWVIFTIFLTAILTAYFTVLFTQ